MLLPVPGLQLLHIYPVSVHRFIWMLIKRTKNVCCEFIVLVRPTHLLHVVTENNSRFNSLHCSYGLALSHSIYLFLLYFKLNIGTDMEIVLRQELHIYRMINPRIAYARASKPPIHCRAPFRVCCFCSVSDVPSRFLEAALRMRV